MVMVQKNIERIKKPLLYPLALALLFALAASLYGMRWVQQQNTTHQLSNDLRNSHEIFQTMVDSEAEKLQAIILNYESDVALQKAFVQRDRNALKELALSILNNKLLPLAIDHFYLIDPEKVSVFRAHAPDSFGDPIKHFTLHKAYMGKTESYGVELGKYGHFSLRVVRPWVIGDELVGYIELGRNITNIVHRLKKILGYEFFISIEKTFLDRALWSEGLSIVGERGDWDEFAQSVIVGRTTKNIPSQLADRIAKGRADSFIDQFEITDKDKRFQGGVISIIDAGEQHIGELVVLMDVTEKVVSVWAMAIYLGAVALAVAVCLFFFFTLYVDKMDTRLASLQSSIYDELADRDSALSMSQNLLEKDIARREEVEREFHRVSLQHQLILDSVVEGIFGLDLMGNHTFVNPQAAKMLGCQVSEIIGRPSHGLWHHTKEDGSTFPEEECPILQTLREGRVQTIEEDLFWRCDGSSFPVHYTSTPIWEDGQVTGAVVSFRDISAHKKAQNALSQSEKRYQAIANTAQDAIILMDENGCVAYWNPAAESIFGYTAEEATGKNLHSLIVPTGYAGEYSKGLDEFQKTGQGSFIGKVVELTAVRKNGEQFQVELGLSSLKQNDRWWAVGMARDISERLLERKHREDLQAQLRQSQKMEAIGTLAGGIAHDFNNILGAIMGYTELALLEAPAGQPLHGHLEQVSKASRRAKDLIAHILAFSRQTEMARKPLEVSAIVKEALKMLRASLPTTIEIYSDVEKGIGQIMADPTQVHQVLMNLCTNAAHAMRETGGRLEIMLHKLDLSSQDIVKKFDLSPGEYLQLSIRDSGIGMDQSIADKIFDPFFTTKERGEGTGMGLSVVHGIVTSHNGAIEVESVPGKGSAFNLYFPLIETATSTQEAGVVRAPPTGKERVLFVDDEAALIELGERVLSYLGYEVTTRTSSLEALELFKVDPEKFDLVVTDFTMPNMTGGELAKMLLEIRPDIPIIMCTGFSEVFTEEKANELGIKGYVMKPISIHDLAQTCRNVLDRAN